MMRKQKPFHDFDRLTSEQLDRIHTSLAESSYEKTRDLLRDEFQIEISYGRLSRYYHRYLETQQIKKQVGVDLTVSDYIKVQNGEALPFGAVTHHLIQKAACQQAAASEDRTIAELLSLQRIANSDFQQKLAREKLALEQRRLALREQELALKRQANAASSTQSTSSTSEPQDPGNKPFRMWTEEEVRTNQPKIEAAFQAHPVLRYIGLPPVDVPPTLPPELTESSLNPCSSGKSAVNNPLACPPAAAPTELDQLLAEARANPEAPFDPRLLKHVHPVPTTAHLSRDLSLPLAHRVTCYFYARQLEEDRGKNSDIVGRWAARNFTSKLNWCPCGQDLPCPDHPPMSPEFYESMGVFMDYLYFCGLPHHELGDLLHRLKKLEEQQNP